MYPCSSSADSLTHHILFYASYSVLMRATYKHDHPMCKLGRGHSQVCCRLLLSRYFFSKFFTPLEHMLHSPSPRFTTSYFLLTTREKSPPLHIHFRQYESFSVLSGSVGTTSTYTTIDTVHTPSTTGEASPHTMPPWTPHTFWPDPDAREDTTILLWAHPNPDDMEDKMDRLFFQNLLMYVSDVAEGKERLSILQVMLVQYVPSPGSPFSHFHTHIHVPPFSVPFLFRHVVCDRRQVHDNQWRRSRPTVECHETTRIALRLIGIMTDTHQLRQ